MEEQLAPPMRCSLCNYPVKPELACVDERDGRRGALLCPLHFQKMALKDGGESDDDTAPTRTRTPAPVTAVASSLTSSPRPSPLSTSLREKRRAAAASAARDLVARRESCLLYTSPSPRDRTRSRMPSSA